MKNQAESNQQAWEQALDDTIKSPGKWDLNNRKSGELNKIGKQIKHEMNAKVGVISYNLLDYFIERHDASALLRDIIDGKGINFMGFFDDFYSKYIELSPDERASDLQKIEEGIQKRHAAKL